MLTEDTMATRTVKIESEAVQIAGGAIPENVPIVMLNLLRFREHAEYGDRRDVASCSGREAYFQRYVPVVGQIMGEGSHIFWLGQVLASVIAPPDEYWDYVALVEYPNFAAFRQLVENPRYLTDAVFHRTAALEDSRLIATAKVTL